MTSVREITRRDIVLEVNPSANSLKYTFTTTVGYGVLTTAKDFGTEEETFIAACSLKPFFAPAAAPKYLHTEP